MYVHVCQSRLGMSTHAHIQGLRSHQYVHYTRTSMEDGVEGRENDVSW